MSAATQRRSRAPKWSVAVDPDRAFEAFTAEIDKWWKKTARLEDKDAGSGFVSSRASGAASSRCTTRTARATRSAGSRRGTRKRLAYTWRQSDWPDDAITDVEITFEPVDAGRGSHASDRLERVPAARDREGLQHGATTLLEGTPRRCLMLYGRAAWGSQRHDATRIVECAAPWLVRPLRAAQS